LGSKYADINTSSHTSKFFPEVNYRLFEELGPLAKPILDRYKALGPFYQLAHLRLGEPATHARIYPETMSHLKISNNEFFSGVPLTTDPKRNLAIIQDIASQYGVNSPQMGRLLRESAKSGFFNVRGPAYENAYKNARNSRLSLADGHIPNFAIKLPKIPTPLIDPLVHRMNLLGSGRYGRFYNTGHRLLGEEQTHVGVKILRRPSEKQYRRENLEARFVREMFEGNSSGLYVPRIFGDPKKAHKTGIGREIVKGETLRRAVPDVRVRDRIAEMVSERAYRITTPRGAILSDLHDENLMLNEKAVKFFTRLAKRDPNIDRFGLETLDAMNRVGGRISLVDFFMRPKMAAENLFRDNYGKFKSQFGLAGGHVPNFSFLSRTAMLHGDSSAITQKYYPSWDKKGVQISG
jgi:hypothetical protein